MLLTESDHPGDVFRVALCDHLPGLDVGGVGGDDDGDDGEFLAAVWASCDAVSVSRCNGVRQAVTGVDDVEDVVDVVGDGVRDSRRRRGGWRDVLARLLFGSQADFDQNRIWCATVQLACERTACLQMLALHEHPARCAYFRSPPASPVTLAEPGCDWLPTPPGNTCSPTR